MGFKFESSPRAYADILLKKIKDEGGGTLNRQLVLNVWVGQARKANVPLETRQAVVRLVQAANV